MEKPMPPRGPGAPGNQSGRNPFGEPIYMPPKTHPSKDERQYGEGHNPSYMVPRSGQDPTLDAFMRKHPGSSNVADYDKGAQFYPWGEGGSHQRETLHPHDDAVDDFDAPGGTHHHPYGNPQDHGGYVDHYRPEEDKINHFNRLSSFDPNDPAVRQLMRHSPGRSLEPIETHEMTREVTPPSGMHDNQPGQFDYPYVRQQPKMHAGEDPEEPPHPTGWAVHKFDPWVDGVHGDEFDRTSNLHRALADPDGSGRNPSVPSSMPQGGGGDQPKMTDEQRHDSLQMDMSGGGSTSNVPQDGGGASASGPGTPGSGSNPLDPNSFTASFFDPRDPSVRVLAAGQTDDSGGSGSAPAPPPQMTPGGPGSAAMPPMAPGGAGGAGNVPQTTPPRQTPGGGGAPGGAGMPGEDPAAGGAPPGVPKSGRWRRVADAPSKAIETLDNPSGVDDEFAGRSYERALEQRPRQAGDDRNVNTPQNPGHMDPIPTRSSPGTPGGEDDEDRREASLIAARAARAVLTGA